MQTMTPASAECFVSWRSGDAEHRNWRYFPKLNLWRDFMPGAQPNPPGNGQKTDEQNNEGDNEGPDQTEDEG